jgi:hypothetical protein
MIGVAVTSNETRAIIASAERGILYDQCRHLLENRTSGFRIHIIAANNVDASLLIYFMFEIVATPKLTIALIDKTHQATGRWGIQEFGARHPLWSILTEAWM